MSWFEQRIRRYEHRRWTKDDNRRVLPFAWGLEHIGGPIARSADPRALPESTGWITPWRTVDEWFDVAPADDYRVSSDEESGRGQVLTFTSAVRSPWPREQSRPRAPFCRRQDRAGGGPAAAMERASGTCRSIICRWLNRMGITVLRLSMPYHDRRAIPGHERADYLVGPNIGLTLQANRQAVLDARRCLLWLDRARLRQVGHGRHQHRLGGRLHHYGA